jgi:hypothetical protein
MREVDVVVKVRPGFLFTQSGVFVHFSELPNREPVPLGTRLSFDRQETAKGPRGVAVQVEGSDHGND